MRVVIAGEIEEGRLPPDSGVAQMYGPDAVTNVCAGHIADAKFWTEISRLEALPPAEYKPQREVARKRLVAAALSPMMGNAGAQPPTRERIGRPCSAKVVCTALGGRSPPASACRHIGHLLAVRCRRRVN
jgi:hypothetical protein